MLDQAEYLLKVEDIIQKHGWLVQYVGAGANALPFCYTVGLHERGLPELLVFSMPYDVAHALLNETVAITSERKLAGQPLAGRYSLKDWPTPFHLVDARTRDAESFATLACRRSEGQASYLQVVWPDTKGSFPWDEGFEAKFKEKQPVL